MHIIEGGRARVQFIPGPAHQALLATLLLALSGTKKGRRSLERTLLILEGEIDRATIPRVHGPRISPATVEGMKQAAAALEGILRLNPETGMSA